MTSDSASQFRDRMEDSLQRTLERFRTLGSVSVGKSAHVQFSDETVAKYQINRMGRMTTQPSKMFFAGPDEVDRLPRYDMPKCDHISFFEAYAQGGKVRCEKPNFALPTPRKQALNPNIHAVESSLLRRLCQRHQGVTLLNPSQGALWRCIESTSGLLNFRVLFLGSYDRKEARSILSQYGLQDREVAPGFDEYPVYVGSNGVCHNGYEYSDFKRWVSLLPNFLMTNFPYDSFSMVYGDSTSLITYLRKGRQIEISFPDCPDYSVYGPTSVDQYLCTHGRAFIMETNFLNLETMSEPDSPVYWMSYFPFIDYPLKEPKVIDGIVYDVPGPGSFLSRYSMIQDYAEDHQLLPVRLISSRDPEQCTWSVGMFSPIPISDGVVRSSGGLSFVGNFEITESDRYDSTLLSGYLNGDLLSEKDRFRKFPPAKRLVIYSPRIRDLTHPSLPAGGYTFCSYVQLDNKLLISAPIRIPLPYYIAWSPEDLTLKQIMILRHLYPQKYCSVYGLATTYEHTGEMSLLDQSISVVAKSLDTEKWSGRAKEIQNSKDGAYYPLATVSSATVSYSLGVPANHIRHYFLSRTDIVEWYVERDDGTKDWEWINPWKLKIPVAGTTVAELWNRWLLHPRLDIKDIPPDDALKLSVFFHRNNRPSAALVWGKKGCVFSRMPDRVVFASQGRLYAPPDGSTKGLIIRSKVVDTET